MSVTVTVELNQQQRQILDRLIADGGYGASHGDVVRTGFLEFCEKHPEIAGAASTAAEPVEDAR